MPAGDLYSREIRSSEPPDELYRRVVVQLTPLLAPAKYELAAEDAQSVQYCRRYLPTAVVIAGLGAIALAGAAVVGGRLDTLVVLIGALGVAVLLFGRRRELLTVSVELRPGGSTAVLSGYLTGRARMSLLGFDPPRGRRLRIASAHARLPETPPAA